MNWIQKYKENHPDSIEDFDKVMRDLTSVNLASVSLQFQHKDDIRPLRDINYKEIGWSGYGRSSYGDVLKSYQISDVDGRGSNCNIAITRAYRTKMDDGEVVSYTPTLFEGAPELYEEAFRKTGGKSSLKTIINRDNFFGASIIKNIGGVGRELYKESSKEVFDDIYEHTLNDLMDDFGEDSEEVKEFEESFRGVNCLDKDYIVENDYTNVDGSEGINFSDPLDEDLIDRLGAEKDFVKDALWNRVCGKLLRPKKEDVIDKAEDGSYFTKEFGLLVGGPKEDKTKLGGSVITIFKFNEDAS